MASLRALVAKYRTSGPRYTSYPTALQLQPMDEAAYRTRLREAARRAEEPWSLYVHVPFCERRCTFCACAVIPTPARERVATPYTEALLAEADLLGAEIGERRGLAQLHLGGGTPTYLEPQMLRALGQGLLTRLQPTADLPKYGSGCRRAAR